VHALIGLRPRKGYTLPLKTGSMALPETEYPACPKHEISMVPHAFDTRDASLLQGTVQGFRCPNLDCSIVYIEGTLKGFYTLEPSGHMAPYLKSTQQ
jgi:hypothetical protein